MWSFHRSFSESHIMCQPPCMCIINVCGDYTTTIFIVVENGHNGIWICVKASLFFVVWGSYYRSITWWYLFLYMWNSLKCLLMSRCLLHFTNIVRFNFDPSMSLIMVRTIAILCENLQTVGKRQSRMSSYWNVAPYKRWIVRMRLFYFVYKFVTDYCKDNSYFNIKNTYAQETVAYVLVLTCHHV